MFVIAKGGACQRYLAMSQGRASREECEGIFNGADYGPAFSSAERKGNIIKDRKGLA